MPWVIERVNGLVFDEKTGVLSAEDGSFLAKIQEEAESGKVSIELGEDVGFFKAFDGLKRHSRDDGKLSFDIGGDLFYSKDEVKLVIKIFRSSDYIIPRQ